MQKKLYQHTTIPETSNPPTRQRHSGRSTMHVVHDDAVKKHAPEVELHRGQTLSPFECPARVESILNELRTDAFTLVAPDQFETSILNRVHAADYITFLETAYKEWSDLGVDGAMVPHVWPSRVMKAEVPDSIFGRLGYYSYDAGTTIAAGTWETLLASAACAMTAATKAWHAKDTTFALCRPPGHHAERAAFGGYCFLNTAALAVEQFLHLGAKRVAVLDVDYHHGNGTQSIFYDRADVLTVSIHANPKIAYPYFCGYEHETGTGDGTGTNRNICLPDGTAWNTYEPAINIALEAISNFAPCAVVVPFGADTFCEDPISTFGLTTDDFTNLGSTITELNLPCAITMEGGYAIDELGRNVAAFLGGF